MQRELGGAQSEAEAVVGGDDGGVTLGLGAGDLDLLDPVSTCEHFVGQQRGLPCRDVVLGHRQGTGGVSGSELREIVTHRAGRAALTEPREPHDGGDERHDHRADHDAGQQRAPAAGGRLACHLSIRCSPRR